MKKISVIVPVYKVEKYLNKCVDSILVQTYDNFELILVDDGSPDNCGQICDEYAQKDSRVKVIHKENGGLSSARNAGLDVATGDYIGFVDSDDYISPVMYEKLLKASDENDADLVICGVEKVDEYGNAITDQCNELASGVISKKEAFNIWFCVTVWNRIYKANVFKNIRFPLGKLHEDEFVAHLVYENSSKIYFIPDKLYFYLQRTDSIMGATEDVRHLDAVEAFLKRAKYYKNKDRFFSKIVYIQAHRLLLGYIDNYKVTHYLGKFVQTVWSTFWQLFLAKELRAFKLVLVFAKKVICELIKR